MKMRDILMMQCLTLSANAIGSDVGRRVIAADIPARGLLSKSPAARWEDGHVTGNGTLGAIVMGNPTNETVIGNHSRLWLPLMPTRDQAAFEKAGLAWNSRNRKISAVLNMLF